MEYEKCHIFQPEDEPPCKKRRVEPQGLHRSWPTRRKQYQQCWDRLSNNFGTALAEVNASNNQDIRAFLKSCHGHQALAQIPTGILLLEPGSSSRSRLFDEKGSTSLQHPGTRIITLDASAASNLKTALKSINSSALQGAGHAIEIETVDEAEEDEPTGSLIHRAKPSQNAGRRRLLAYDLRVLQEYTKQASIQSLVIHMEDTEGFGGEVLSELIEHLSYWRNRIPIVLLMNVSTSIDMLERRLSKAARSKLACRVFAAATCEEEFEALTAALAKDEAAVVIGPSLMRLAAQRQGEYLQDIATLQGVFRYALMSAYFANPLTLFLSTPPRTTSRSTSELPQDHCQALRKIPSFKLAIQQLLDKRDVATARSLLTSDAALADFAYRKIRQGKNAVHGLFLTVSLVRHIQKHMPSAKDSSLASLYIQGLCGTLARSAHLRGMFLAMRKASVASLEKMINLDRDQLPSEEWYNQCRDDSALLCQLIESSDGQPSGTNLTNGQGHNAMGDQRTCAELVTRICKTLEAKIDHHLINPKELPFHEVFLWDLTSPYREAFMPRPRQAIERALSTPHDYLDCDCCGQDETELSASQPSTAILYSLYKESGNLINAHDAWQAFQAVTEDNADEEESVVLFQRSLAELKHLGMVKGTRKRVDHIAKVAWPGL